MFPSFPHIIEQKLSLSISIITYKLLFNIAQSLYWRCPDNSSNDYQVSKEGEDVERDINGANKDVVNEGLISNHLRFESSLHFKRQSKN